MKRNNASAMHAFCIKDGVSAAFAGLIIYLRPQIKPNEESFNRIVVV
ncbi:MAG TPA: hypothetical protein PLJ19_03150 [Dysgonamonadaceae bacterium]|jgi:hypothetical protein|nr:hypothetical protein [Dysgonamonadaceae bacterium]